MPTPSTTAARARPRMRVESRPARGRSRASRGEARSSFLRARLASGLAILPLGVWTSAHLWNNLAAFQGAEAWQRAVTEYPHPFAEALTGVVVLLPLAIHTIWGIGRLASSRPNNLRYPFYGNLKYLLQRVAAVGVLFFLGAHLWLAMLRPRLQEGRPEPFADIAQEMHFHTPTLVVYVLGTLGVAYHLANGVQSFCMGWGVVTSERALKRLEWVALLLFVLLLAMSWGAIYALWAAGAPAS
jgi:succinate dehydrogenase / fumarate reductase cytochrome b subunit